MKKNKVKVKTLQETPEFYGMDLKKYGPFKKGQTTEMPPIVAKTFIEKKLGKQNQTTEKTSQILKKDFFALQKKVFKNEKIPQLHFIAYGQKNGNGDVWFDHIHNEGFNTLELLGIITLFKNDLLEKQRQKNYLKNMAGQKHGKIY